MEHDELSDTERGLTSAARHLLAIVHRADIAGVATDSAAADLAAGAPWYGLEGAASELRQAGLLDIEPPSGATVPPGAEPMPSMFLRLTERGHHVAARAADVDTTDAGGDDTDPTGNDLAFDDD